MLIRTFMTAAILMCGAAVAQAHTPLCSCFYDDDNTIICEGAFSDGSSASGVAMRVKSADGKVLFEGEMNEDSEYTFKKPEGDFYVIFDAGDGHRIKVTPSDIN